MANYNRITIEYATEWLLGAMTSGIKELWPNAKGGLSKLGTFGKYSANVEAVLLQLLNKSFMEGCIFKVGQDGKFYAYNGRYYDYISKPVDFVSALIALVLKKAGVGWMYHQKATAYAKDLVRDIKFDVENVFTLSRRYIAFTNGVFDLKDGRLKAFNPKYITEIVIDIPYVDVKTHYAECERKYGHSQNPCRLWDEFVGRKDGEGVIPNADMRTAFQCFCGAMLVDRDEYKIEKMAIVYGKGRNGKSVLVDAVSGVFGSKYFSGYTPRELAADSLAGERKRYDVNGRLMNITGDLDNADFSSGFLKAAVSADKNLQGRALYESESEKIRMPLMLCCTNQIPDNVDDSIAYYERLLPIKSTDKVYDETNKDPQLTAKLTTEDARVYIFSWIYEGYKRLIKNNGCIPLGDGVRESMRAIMKHSNSLRRWFADDFPYKLPPTKDDGQWVQSKDIYAHYENYCLRHREVRLSQKAMADLLRSEGWVGEFKREHRVNYYRVIDRKPEDFE